MKPKKVDADTRERRPPDTDVSIIEQLYKQYLRYGNKIAQLDYMLYSVSLPLTVADWREIRGPNYWEQIKGKSEYERKYFLLQRISIFLKHNKNQ
jgi:hypothetical protein